MNRKEILLIILILILGSILRIFTLGSESFWLDESGTAQAVKEYSSFEVLENGLVGNLTPNYWKGTTHDLPFYFVLLSFWVKLFSVSEVSLRLLSAIFGSLSILMVFFVAKELVSNKVALLSSFIFALSMTNIEYSQEARLYSFMSFIALSSVYFLIKSFKTGKMIYLAMFIISNIIGLYTHFTFVFFIAFEAVYILIMFKTKYIKKFVFSLFIIGLSYLPIIPRFFQASSGTDIFGKPTLFTIAKVWVMFNTWLYPSSELYSNIYSRNLYFISTLDWLLILSVFLLVLITTIFFIIGLFDFKERSNTSLALRNLKNNFVKNKWTLFLLLWFLIPIVLEYLLSVLHPTISIFGPIRYLIFVFPAFIILVSKGILSLNLKYSSIVIILIIIFSILPLTSYYTNINKQQWREVALFMKENIKNGEIVMINNPNAKLSFSYYYGKSSNVFGVPDAKEAERLSKNKEDVWLILSGERYTDPKGTIKGYLETQYILDKEERFFDIRVLYYRNNFK